MKTLVITFLIFFLLIAQEQCNDKETTNTEQTNQEKKIEIDPNTVVYPAPEYKRCGADDLNIKPKPISPANILPENGEETKTEQKTIVNQNKGVSLDESFIIKSLKNYIILISLFLLL